MKRSAPVAILLASGLIAGCSTTKSQNTPDFQSVVAAQPAGARLEVPPDLTSPQIQDKYTIPGTSVASADVMAKDMAATPQAGTPAADSGPVLARVNDVKMVRAGSQRWLVVSGKTPAQLWPLLKAFWQDNGFTIKKEEPDIGVMETDWAENRANLPNDPIRSFLETVGLGSIYSTAQRDMFRIRLEHGQNGGTEVYFSDRGMKEVYVNEGKSQTMWEPRAPDPELEAEMLGRFMIRLGLSEEQAHTAVRQSEAPVKAEAPPINNGTLVINDSFDRAWRRVGLALDRTGLTVNDRNRSAGIYYVTPVKSDPDSKQADKSSAGSFWSSMAFWRSNDKTQVAAPADNSLQVLVKQSDPDHTAISITDKDGKVLTDAFAKNALSKLQGELQ